MMDRFLKMAEVLKASGLGRTSLWRMEGNARFPRRVKISPGRVGWRESEVSAWLEDPAGWQAENGEDAA